MISLLEILTKGKRNQTDDVDEVLQFALKHEAIVADYEMSKLSPSLIPQVSGLLNEALKSDIPSICARARNILKEMEHA